MPSIRLVPRTRANVRYNRELECFEMYCPECPVTTGGGQCFWPLDVENWDPHNMQRCRACNMRIRRDYAKKKQRAHPDYAAYQKDRRRIRNAEAQARLRERIAATART